MKIKLAAKKSLSVILFHSRLLNFFKKQDLPSAIILAYHRVLPEDSEFISYSQPGMYVTEKTFEMHLHYLSENYQILSLEQFNHVSDLSNKCFITFDDGWVDNYTSAFPILKKFQVPATIFISTGYTGTRKWHWPDQLSYLLYSSNRGQINKIIDIVNNWCQDRNQIKYKQKSHINRESLREKIIEKIKKLDSKKVALVLDDIRKVNTELDSHFNTTQLWLDWDQIIEMSENMISFGAHTHNHVILTQTYPDTAKQEILQSRDIINEKTGKAVRLFSYPNGNWNEKIKSWLNEFGFETAVTTRRGRVNPSDDPLLLPRISIHEDITNTLPMFLARISDAIPFF